MHPSLLADARQALAGYGLADAPLAPLGHGNINKTFVVQAPSGRFVLQRLNPIFPAEIHHDIEAVTAHLQQHGMVTLRLCRSQADALWVTLPHDHSIWRLQTYIDGAVHARAESPALCTAAGALLGRFHALMHDFDAPFAAARQGVHDTAKHLAGLEQALISHRDHTAYTAVAPLAEAILSGAHALPALGGLRAWYVHGDAKLVNMVFARDAAPPQALALIDLDTLNRFPLALELGDALRSWCNPHGEDHPAGSFDVGSFRAAIEGYSSTAGHLLQAAEVEQLHLAPELIALELAARFARDALEERYFGWDSGRFAHAWEHHLLRARGQLAVARACCAQRNALWQVLRHAFKAFDGQRPGW